MLWLWRRLAAVAPVGPLAWETPYATGVALKIQNTKKLKKLNKGQFSIARTTNFSREAQTFTFCMKYSQFYLLATQTLWAASGPTTQRLSSVCVSASWWAPHHGRGGLREDRSRGSGPGGNLSLGFPCLPGCSCWGSKKTNKQTKKVPCRDPCWGLGCLCLSWVPLPCFSVPFPS